MPWEEREKKLLCERYAKISPRFINKEITEEDLFELIACEIPNRTASACLQQYKKLLGAKRLAFATQDITLAEHEDPPGDDESDDPLYTPQPAKRPKAKAVQSRRGRWSAEEKRRFHEVYLEVGTSDWTRYPEHIGTRNAESCEKYYKKYYLHLKEQDSDRTQADSEASLAVSEQLQEAKPAAFTTRSAYGL
jgi:hypothetical protein